MCFGLQIMKKYLLGISVRQTVKRGVIYILIAILFYVHLRVNVAAILDFFFKMYSTVMFILGSLSYYKYGILLSAYLVV